MNFDRKNQKSAGDKKTTRIGCAGAYQKPLLVQIALNCEKSDNPPAVREFTAVQAVLFLRNKGFVIVDEATFYGV